MLSARVLSYAVVCGALVACGPSTSDVLPNEEIEDAVLTGRFTGRFTSDAQDIALDGLLTLDLSESAEGRLHGEFRLEGVLDDGEFQQPIAGTGPLVGSISPEQVAPLYFTARPDFCPDESIEFAGYFDRRNVGLIISGPILILDAACEVVLSFPSTIALRR